MTDRAKAARAVIDIGRGSALWREPRLDVLIRRAAAAALEAAGVAPAPGTEVSVLLTDDVGMRALNGTWRGERKPTNVLSFPAAPPAALETAPHLGDVVLAHETVAAEAEHEGRRFADHVAHLVVHGVLHLLGHDHKTDRDAAEMEKREVAALASLGIADPYVDLVSPDGAAGARRPRAGADEPGPDP